MILGVWWFGGSVRVIEDALRSLIPGNFISAEVVPSYGIWGTQLRSNT